MTVLWIAFGIYIIGVATILVIRPTTMFHTSGSSWKEFGLSSNGTSTVFPFWMFAIVWALISYALATLGMMFMATITLNSVPEYVSMDNINAKPISSINTNPPGYYVLDEMNQSSPPKYLFYGTQPPK